MPVSGITSGCQPVLGYNYGARQYSRVRQGVRFTAAVTMVYSVAVWAATMLFPEQLICIFNNEADVYKRQVLICSLGILWRFRARRPWMR